MKLLTLIKLHSTDIPHAPTRPLKHEHHNRNSEDLCFSLLPLGEKKTKQQTHLVNNCLLDLNQKLMIQKFPGSRRRGETFLCRYDLSLMLLRSWLETTSQSTLSSLEPKLHVVFICSCWSGPSALRAAAPKVKSDLTVFVSLITSWWKRLKILSKTWLDSKSNQTPLNWVRIKSHFVYNAAQTLCIFKIKARTIQM